MNPPNLLIIAGLDPSGGAGLAADIQTATAFGVHPAPVASLLTVQDTVNVAQVQSLEPKFVVAQSKAVLGDMPVSAVKLGALGTAQIGQAVADLLSSYPDIPVVTDPVLVASGGGSLAHNQLIEVYQNRLFPLSIVATPNRQELEILSSGHGATALLERGLPACLVTDGEGAGDTITHELHRPDGVKQFENGRRLAGRFHGTGCTLSSAIAAHLALGDKLETAIEKGARYVQKAVADAFKPGKGQQVPKR